MSEVPKHDKKEALQRSSRHLVKRIAQAFPQLSEGLQLNGFKVTFEPDQEDSRLAIGRAIYGNNGQTLEAIQLNRTILAAQYDKLKEDTDISFEDLVRVHVGIGFSMHLLFQRMMMPEKKGTNIVTAMVQFLNDQDRIKAAFQESPSEISTSGYIMRAVDRLSLDLINGPEKIVNINAQRMAFGMTIAAENTYSSTEGTGVMHAMQESIRERLLTDATGTALMGIVLTGDRENSWNVASDRLLDVQDFALAIPAPPSELGEFLLSISKAENRPEFFDTSDLLELSNGFDVRSFDE